MNVKTRLLSTAAIVLGAMVTPAIASDDTSDSFRDLSAQWWQWAMSIPAASNPLVDPAGANCMVGQRGQVWFLAASLLGAPVVRTCTVPAGVPLFFPVFNVFSFNSPGCGQGPGDLSVAEMRGSLAPLIDGATGLSVLLDNRPITSLRRVRSEVFATVLPPNDVLSANFGITCIVPGQLYSPSVDDGYYVMLRNLPEGTHHLSVKGTNQSGFLVDAFYTLNVVKTVLKDRN